MQSMICGGIIATRESSKIMQFCHLPECITMNLSTIILPSDLNNDICDVKTELIRVAAKWRAVGIALGLQSDTLDIIETRCSSDPCQRLEMMVTEWLKRNYNVRKFGEPTWQKLVEAVNSPAGGANTAHARDIAGRHKAGGVFIVSCPDPPARAKRVWCSVQHFLSAFLNSEAPIRLQKT